MSISHDLNYKEWKPRLLMQIGKVYPSDHKKESKAHKVRKLFVWQYLYIMFIINAIVVDLVLASGQGTFVGY